MRYLLDTNVLLIWLGDASRVTPTMTREIRSEANTIFFSPLSIWECHIKAARGQLQVDDNLLEIVRGKQFFELQFTAGHANETRSLPAIHRDPFDRGLVAQARVEKLCLLTTDRTLREYPVDVVLA